MKILKSGILSGLSLLLLFFSACEIESPYMDAIQEKMHKDIGTLSVIYDGNGNTGGTAPVDENYYLETWPVTAAENSGNLVKAGFTFVGWNTAADGSGTDHSSGASFEMGPADLTLYANWSQDPTYTVTYDGNGNTGGTVPVDANNYEAGMTVTVKGDSGGLLKTGFIYKRWNAKADGTGTSYSAGDTFTVGNADVVLYAEWDPTYTISYDGNGNTGGTVPIDGNNYEAGAEVTVKGNSGGLIRTDFVYYHWNTKPDGTGMTYSENDILSMGNEDIILYAKWEPTYDVTYDPNNGDGGSVPEDNNRYETGETVTVLENTGTLTRSGGTPSWVFTGWNTKADQTGIKYPGSQSFTMGVEDITLYAHWTQADTWQVVYSGNGNTGGDIPSDPNNYEQGDTVTVRGNTGNLVRTNYDFDHWDTEMIDTGDGGTDYYENDTFNMPNGGRTLYAIWAPTYKVTYNGDSPGSGSVPIDNGNYRQNAAVTVLGNTGSLAKDGFDFGGWNYNSNTYSAGQTFSMPALASEGDSVTLTAVWVPTYQVIYDGNGSNSGTVPMDSERYRVGDQVTVLGNSGNLAIVNVDNKSNSFSEWSTNSGGGNPNYSEGNTFIMGAADETLYAQYAECTLRDTGPAGGLIFYDKGSYSGTPSWRYLEAAPVPAGGDNNIGWGLESDDISGAEGTGIGDGWVNTTAIIGKYGSGSTYPAQICDGLSEGGYDDWFLPSKDELHEMYNELANYGVGDFVTYWYWSSSQWDISSDRTWRHVMTQGYSEQLYYTALKSTLFYHRAVRRF